METEPNLIINFLGLPGSGKSTFAQKLHKQLQKKYLGETGHYVSLNQISKRAAYTRYLANPFRILQSLPRYKQFLGGNRLDYDTFGWILKNEAFYHFIKYHTLHHSGFHIYDENVLHRLWSLTMNSDTEKLDFSKLPRLMEHLMQFRNPLYVIVSIDPETAIKRLMLRKETRSRLDKLSEVELRNVIESNLRVFAEVKELLLKTTSRIIEIDGKKNFKENMAEVMSAIEKAI